MTEDDNAKFTERTVMSLVVEIADLEENTRRLSAIVTALAKAHDVGLAIDPVSAIVK